MAQQEELSLIIFQKKFSSNKDCRKHLFKLRWPEGFKCPKCGNNHYHYLSARKLYQCSACHHQTSVIAGTIMYGSKTALKKWYWTVYLYSKDKGGISAMALKKHIKVAFQTARAMLHKI
jgi:ribosomal protein L37AE/L43A